ncbi:MAG: ATP-binding cassette domain-containing protein [Clostridia bacterium]|nr:ATP-binding cassette domain-containing protein [Clostridia bacterium]
MLEARNLCKIYKPARGVPVRALDGVSLRLPERGMVFLLGKSGSGKSTLLNLLGGLDRYDGGDVLIKGVSTKTFSQQDFDTYRNTYVGFVFQEYNVLEEFTVGANIALAIELQGAHATDEQIEDILREVDLQGYGNRRPSELSGGQKQRVAIARALIKSPEIIMADEPTGALDSATGRAVLDTLKRLSADKLVLVVSHDREFAERYADRIIELSDGRVVSDVEYVQTEQTDTSALRYEGNTVAIPPRYRLTEQDRLAINEYLASLEGDAELRIETARTARQMRPTDESAIPCENGLHIRRIKSKLPLKCAFKIGAGALKHKRIRLVLTVLLSCVAFILFGLSDTFSAYNHIRTTSRSLVDSGITYASVAREEREGDSDYYRGTKLDEADIATLREQTGRPFHGVLSFSSSLLKAEDGSIEAHYDGTVEALQSTGIGGSVFASHVAGLTEMTEAGLAELDYRLLAGRMPDGARDEIAVSTYLLETFLRGGYRAYGETDYQSIASAEDMVGKTLRLGGVTFTVTGIFDVPMDLLRYMPLQTTDASELSAADTVMMFALYSEFEYAQGYSYASLGLVGEGYLASYLERQGARGYDIYEHGSVTFSRPDGDNVHGMWPSTVVSLERCTDADIYWLDGARESLAENEIIVSADLLYDLADAAELYMDDGDDVADLAEYLKQHGLDRDWLLTQYWWGGDMPDLTEDGQESVCIVGLIDHTRPNADGELLVSDAMYETIQVLQGGIYSFAVAPMPATQSDIRALVAYCYDETSDVRYPMQNAVTFELDLADSLLEVLSDVFMYIGIFFAGFAALMLANFIGTSIAYKKQEIGILRAIGSRGNDVFRIFFAESFIIASVNFLLSAIGTALVTSSINRALRESMGLLITVLHFGLRQILLLLVISLAVAALASFLPVRRIASKRPIDAIRNR